MAITQKMAGRRIRTDDLRNNSPSLDRLAKLACPVFVLLCFIETDIGESLRSRGHSLRQGTWGGWILILHLNCVAGYTGPLLFLFEQTPQLLRWQPGACALAAPSCGQVQSSFGLIGEVCPGAEPVDPGQTPIFNHLNHKWPSHRRWPADGFEPTT